MKTCLSLLTAALVWLSLPVSAAGGDLRRQVKYKGLGSIVGDEGSAGWIVCGNDRLNIESKNFADQFFVGPEPTGLMIKGLSGHQLHQWQISLAATELNAKITAALREATVYFVKNDGSKVSKATFSKGSVNIPHSSFDCKTSVPATMNCSTAAGDPRPGCCEEGVNKQFKFTADFNDASGEIWRFKYYPGDGNSNITSKAGKGLLRHCLTSGMISLEK